MLSNKKQEEEEQDAASCIQGQLSAVPGMASTRGSQTHGDVGDPFCWFQRETKRPTAILGGLLNKTDPYQFLGYAATAIVTVAIALGSAEKRCAKKPGNW